MRQISFKYNTFFKMGGYALPRPFRSDLADRRQHLTQATNGRLPCDSHRRNRYYCTRNFHRSRDQFVRLECKVGGDIDHGDHNDERGWPPTLTATTNNFGQEIAHLSTHIRNLLCFYRLIKAITLFSSL